MAELLPPSVKRLVQVFSRLPGVGQRTATRFVLALVRDGQDKMGDFVAALSDCMGEVTLCPRCHGLSTGAQSCGICGDPNREADVLCVVESVADQLAMESAGQFRGHYFILHRLLSPLKGIGPEEIGLPDLLDRAGRGELKEVIVATPMTTDGETTATYLKRSLQQRGVPVSRLASGVPVGGAIEYLDQLTLARALQNRQQF